MVPDEKKHDNDGGVLDQPKPVKAKPIDESNPTLGSPEESDPPADLIGHPLEELKTKLQITLAEIRSRFDEAPEHPMLGALADARSEREELDLLKEIWYPQPVETGAKEQPPKATVKTEALSLHASFEKQTTRIREAVKLLQAAFNEFSAGEQLEQLRAPNFIDKLPILKALTLRVDKDVELPADPIEALESLRGIGKAVAEDSFTNAQREVSLYVARILRAVLRGLADRHIDQFANAAELPKALREVCNFAGLELSLDGAKVLLSLDRRNHKFKINPSGPDSANTSSKTLPHLSCRYTGA